jgi:RNA polymerase sigma-32 factor
MFIAYIYNNRYKYISFTGIENNTSDDIDGISPNAISDGIDVLDEILQEEYDGYIEKIANILEDLDPRTRDIFVSRCLAEKPVGLKELSVKYNISMERVRQVEQQAVRKISQLLGIGHVS